MAKATTKLHAPKGTDEANHDGHLYRADNEGNIEVPDEAIDLLTKTGGFVAEDKSDDDPTGSVRVKSVNGGTSFSWGGNPYTARADGSFLVPAVAVADLLPHGFVADDAPEAEDAPAADPAKPPTLTIPKK